MFAFWMLFFFCMFLRPGFRFCCIFCGSRFCADLCILRLSTFLEQSHKPPTTCTAAVQRIAKKMQVKRKENAETTRRKCANAMQNRSKRPWLLAFAAFPEPLRASGSPDAKKTQRKCKNAQRQCKKQRPCKENAEQSGNAKQPQRKRKNK